MRRVLVVAAIATALALGTVVAFVGVTGISASLPDVSVLERRIPVHTSLMRRRVAEARSHGRALRIDQRWIPYERISPVMRRASMISRSLRVTVRSFPR